MDAAVVRKVTRLVESDLRIIPAPKKPTPETIWAAILAGEFGSACWDIKVKSMAEPMTKELVLIPAGLPRSSRSVPMRNPHRRVMRIAAINSISAGLKMGIG